MNDRESRWFTKTIGSEPYTYQKDIYDGTGRFRIINKSRGTGLSTAVAFKALRHAIRGGQALIVSSSEKQSIRVMTEYVERFLKALPVHLKLVEDSKSTKRFENGGQIYSLPNQANTIRGFNAPGMFIVIDEAAHFLNDTDVQMKEAITPMAARGGSIIMISTPFGEQNIFAKTWQDPNNGYEKITVNWRECPHLVTGIDTIRRTMDSITFDQEYENVFRGEVETEFPMKLTQTAIDPELVYEVNATGDVAGVDIGRRRDLTAICIIRKTGERIRLVEKHIWAGTPFEEQQTRILDIAKRVGMVHIDQGGMGEAPAEWLMTRAPNVRPILFTNENKTEMFLGLKRLFEQRLIQMPFDSRVLQSLGMVRRYYRLGRVVIDAERTDELGHADEATALALACYEYESGQLSSTLLDCKCVKDGRPDKDCRVCGGTGELPFNW